VTVSPTFAVATFADFAKEIATKSTWCEAVTVGAASPAGDVAFAVAIFTRGPGRSAIVTTRAQVYVQVSESSSELGMPPSPPVLVGEEHLSSNRLTETSLTLP